MAVSMHGLDLAFLKANPLPKKRGRPKKKVTFSHLRSDVATPYFVGDIKPFENVANPEKRQEITSRSQLRAFERDFKCHQVGDDFGVGKIGAKNEAKKAEWKRKAAGVNVGWTNLG